MKRRLLKIFGIGIVVTVIAVVVMLGTLIYPGWSFAWLDKVLAGRVDAVVPGVRVEVSTAHVQLYRAREWRLEVGGFVMGEQGGEDQFTLERAQLRWPVGRLLRGRVMPEQIVVDGVAVWVRELEEGQFHIPVWLEGLLGEESPEQPEGPQWLGFRLGSLPVIMKLQPEERMQVEMRGYAAHILRGQERLSFYLPELWLDMTGTPRGVVLSWHAEDRETVGGSVGSMRLTGFGAGHQRILEGGMQVDVLSEQVEWQNRLQLPLTPGLAAWLRSGFPYLPVPGFLQTEVGFDSSGTIDLDATRMALRGELVLAAGAVELPLEPVVRIGIPPVTTRFESELALVQGSPRMATQIAVRIGEQTVDARMDFTARLDGGEDELAVSTSGAFENFAALLALLPDELRPVEMVGQLAWEAEFATIYSAPVSVQRGILRIDSEGIGIRFRANDYVLEMGDFRFRGEVRKGGQEVRIEPFSLQVGPIAIAGSGMDWQVQEDRRHAEGMVRMDTLRLGDVLDILPREWVAVDPELEQWLRRVTLEQAECLWQVSGAADEALPIHRLELLPQMGLSISGRPIDWAGRMAFELNDGKDLTANLSAHVRAQAIELALAAHISPYPVLPALGDRLEASLNLNLPTVGLIEFWHYLPSSMQAAMGLTESEVADFALAKALSWHNLEVSGLPQWPVLAIGDLSGKVQLITGAQSVEIDYQTDRTEEEHSVVRLSMAPYTVGNAGLRLADRLPFPAAALQLPFTGEVAVTLPATLVLDEREPYLEQIHVAASVTMPGGYIAANEFLPADLPVRRMHAEFALTPLALQLERGSAVLELLSGSYIATAESMTLQEGVPTGFVVLEALQVLPAELMAYVDPALLPEQLQPYWGDLEISGGLQRASVRARMGADGPESLPQGIAGVVFEMMAGVGVRHPQFPDLDIAGIQVSGSEAGITVEVADAGVAGARLTEMVLRVGDPLGVDPTIVWDADLHLAWDPLLGHLERMEMADMLPEGIGGGDLALEMTGRLLATGSLQQAFRGTVELQVEPLQLQQLLEGSLPVRADWRWDPVGKVSFNMDADLTHLATHVDGLAVNKQAGLPARLGFAASGSGLLADGEPPQVQVKVDMRNFLLDRVQLEVDAGFTAGFAGEYAGLQTARLRFEGMDYSDISMELDARDGALWRFQATSQKLNLAPLMQQFEPWMLSLLADEEPVDALAGAALAGPADKPVAQEEASTADAVPHPPMQISLNLDSIQFGSVQQFGPLVLDTRIRNVFVDEMHFSLQNAAEALRITIAPLSGELADYRRSFRMELGEVGHWLRTGVRPLLLLQSPAAQQNDLLQQVRALPSYFDRGDLLMAGQFQLQPAWQVDVDHFSLRGLRLRTEVPFFSRIAALVNRRLILEVPFAEFRAGLIQANAEQVQGSDFFMEGPINLSLEKVRYEMASGHTHIEGRVFGVAFEVLGVPPDLQFFLKERSPVIRTITVEDDFEW